MNYEEFKLALQKDLMQYIPSKMKKLKVVYVLGEALESKEDSLYFYYIKNRKVTKGVTIRVKDVFDQYLRHGNLARAVGEIVDSVQLIMKPEAAFQYENIRENTIPQLLNTDMNQKLLEKVPHRAWNDLSIVYQWKLGGDACGICYKIVSNKMMEKIGMTEEELFQQALKNMKRDYPIKVQTIQEAAYEMQFGIPMDENMRLELEPEPEQLYFIANTSKKFGASVVLDQENLQQIAEKLGSGFYVFFESHDALIAVRKEEMDLAEVQLIAKEMNSR